MLKLFFGYLLLISLFGLACGRADSDKHKPVEASVDISILADNLGHIAGMLIDEDKIYLSMLPSLKIGAKEGQGKILQLDTNGKLLSKDFLPGIVLHAPKGLILRNHKLYICDIDSIKVVDINSKKLLNSQCFSFRNEVRTKLSRLSKGRLVVQGTELYPGLMDIVASGDSNIIFASVMNSGNIYRLNTKTKRRQKLASTPYVNSLVYLQGTLYANGFTTGRTTIKILHADSVPQIQEFPLKWETQGALASLCLWQDKYLLFSDWGADYVQNGQVARTSVLLKADMISGIVSQLNYRGEPKYFAGISDLVAKQNTLYLTTLVDGSIYKIQNLPLK